MVMLEEIIKCAAQLQASDVHMAAGERVWVRVQGSLRPLDYPALTAQQLQCYLSGMLADNLQQMLATRGEVDCALDIAGHRCRVNVYCQKGSPACALRLLPQVLPSCEQLGIPRRVQQLAMLQQGLVLVTGATGSGKSTTLAALVQLIAGARSAHIITLEDPIEYVYRACSSLIHQREVGRDTQSFASGLRSALREDPDVLLVGELRDAETMAIAMTAAETGHLVLATLHTRDTASSINRILDVLPDKQQARTQLAECLQGVICQQLLPRRGSPGRAAAFEILLATDALRNLIREGSTHQLPSYLQTGRRHGMCTMEDAVAALRRQGIIE